MTYAETYAAWRADPEGFWREAARGVEWTVAPGAIFDAGSGPYGRWFPDARGTSATMRWTGTCGPGMGSGRR